jgi:glucosylceramidase
MMRRIPLVFLVFFLLLNGFVKAQVVQQWLTMADRSVLFTRQADLQPSTASKNNAPTITIDDRQKFQSVDGFGFALTGGSAQHIIKMSPPARAALLQELFATGGNSIGISYLRLSIGASDLNEKVFSYNDLPEGQTDLSLQHFDLSEDKKDIIPVMREILAINPKIKIMASPWSPPLWMKTSYDARGGMLKPEYYDVYARYFVRYIQEMKKEGIAIDAITVQNEPLHPGNNPSLLMAAPDQAIFIKNNLGPAFKAANLKTKIIIYDHNADRPDYPISILDDPQASQYIDGSAFHLYGGKIEALSDVHRAHPDKNIYFSEQMVVEPPDSKTINIINPVRRLIIGAMRNWSKNVIEWNLAADPDNKPFTDRGGCSMCQGAITINGDRFTKNLAYYSIAHASKFVRPGAVRIASNELVDLPNVAFKTADGKMVLIVANTGKELIKFNITHHQKQLSASLQKGAVATYIW